VGGGFVVEVEGARGVSLLELKGHGLAGRPLLALTNGHGRYTTATPERTLVSVGEWPLHIAVINL
jgi:hypothetical protein